MAAPSKAFHIIYIYLFAGKAVSTQITVMVKTGVRGVYSYFSLEPEDLEQKNPKNLLVKKEISKSTPRILKAEPPLPSWIQFLIVRTSHLKEK